MATFASLIHDTEEHLLAGDRDEINSLNGPIGASDTTLSVNYQLNGIQQGAYIGLDLEVLYVWATDDTAGTVTVQRGMLGSTPAAHVDDTIAYVNPKFSKWAISKAVNMEIRDLSAPPNGLFRVKSFSLTTQPVARGYAVPSANTDLLQVLEIRWQAPGPELEWPRVSRHDFAVLRSMPTTGPGSFTSGMGIRIDRSLYPGMPMTVRYSAPFSELANLTDDVTTVAGIPVSAVDIPSLGAAARLMGVRAAKRSFVESEVDSRRAGEVPAGASAQAAQVLLALVNERIRTEYMRLVEQWPEIM